MPSSPNDLRRALLDEARRLLIAEGFHGLSMRRIAGAVGCTATSIYLYFENKDALVHALIDEGFEALIEALEAVVPAHSSPPDQLRALCERYIAFGVENPELYEVMFMLHAQHMERYPAERYRRARRSLDLLADVLSRGAARGDFRASDPRVSASAIWATLHGFVSLHLMQRLDVRIDARHVRQAVVANALQAFMAPGSPEAAEASGVISTLNHP